MGPAEGRRYGKGIVAAAAAPTARSGGAVEAVRIAGGTAYEVIVLRLEGVVVDEVLGRLAARLLLGGLPVAARTVGRGEPRRHGRLGRRGGR